MGSSKFTLEWSDFSGGYWVGQSDLNQPDDSFRGTGVYVDPNDGMLNAVADWSQITYASGSPTTADTSGYAFMFTSGSNVYRAYTTTTSNTANIAKYANADTGSATVTNTAITNCSVLFSACAWTDDAIYLSWYPSSGANNYGRYVPSTGTLTKYTTTDALRYLARFGEFMVGAGSLGGPAYRLYYSAAYDPTTWAGSYVDIGDAGAITAIVPFGDALYISKSDGWYVLTGILGTSTEVRPIATGTPGVGGNYGGGGAFSTEDFTTAAACPWGVIFSSPLLDATAGLINGNSYRTLNYAYTGDGGMAGAHVRMISPGVYALGRRVDPIDANNNRACWILDTRLGSPRWFKLLIPSSSSSTAVGNWAQWLPGAAVGQTQYQYVDKGSTIYRARLFPSAELASTAHVTGIAHLNERRRIDPFAVRELCVEIAWSASSSAVPTLTTQLERRGLPEHAATGRITTNQQTATIDVQSTDPASALAHDRPYIYRTMRFAIGPNTGTAVVPILRFSECKIRRVWAVCETEGAA